MSAMGAEDESGTVREEGTCGEGKVVEGKQLEPIEKSEFTLLSASALGAPDLFKLRNQTAAYWATHH